MTGNRALFAVAIERTGSLLASFALDRSLLHVLLEARVSAVRMTNSDGAMLPGSR